MYGDLIIKVQEKLSVLSLNNELIELFLSDIYGKDMWNWIIMFHLHKSYI